MNLLDTHLPIVTREEQAMHERINTHLARKVFALGDLEFFLASTALASQKAVRVCGSYLGNRFTVWVDIALVNHLLTPLALAFEKLSPNAKAMLIHTQLRLPEHLQIESMEEDHAPEGAYTLEGVSYTTGARLGWTIGFTADFPIELLASALEPYLKGVMASHLAKLPMTLPLIASTLTIPSAMLEQIEEGDVLLLGNA